ncbi:hypothetical protein BH11ACT2_BH11ACT2_07530 [soil metagenome]
MSLLPKPGDVAAMRFWGLDSRGAKVFSLGILAALVLAVGIWLLVTGISALVATEQILSGGHRVSAQIVSVQSTVPNPLGSPNDAVRTTTIRFTTASGRTVDTDLPSNGVQLEIDPGAHVDIVYDSDHPTRVVLAADGVAASYWAGPIVGALLTAVGAVLALWGIRIFRRGRTATD